MKHDDIPTSLDKQAWEKFERRKRQQHRPDRRLRIVARDGVASADELQGNYESTLARRNADHLPNSVLWTVDWMLKNQTPEYFSAWLGRRTAEEQRQIAKYIAEKN